MQIFKTAMRDELNNIKQAVTGRIRRLLLLELVLQPFRLFHKSRRVRLLDPELSFDDRVLNLRQLLSI